MSRSVMKRIQGILVALLFGLNSAELRAAHSCPMHDGPMPVSTAAAGHAHHAGPSSDAPAPEHHRCTCPDASCGTSSLVAIPARSVSLTIEARFATATVISPALQALRSWTPYLLPYPQGPPASELIA